MAIDVPSQDGNVYCKREVKDDAGAWRRCDGHQYSSCGNSYISVKIPSGSFYAWPQRLDSDKGAKKTLRFRMYQGPPWNLESNEGAGIVDDADVAKCRYDQMALSMTAPFEDVAAVATGKVTGGEGSFRANDGVEDAIEGLRRFYSDPRVFPLIQGIIDSLPPVDTKELRAEDRYRTCLRALSAAGLGKSDAVVKYVSAHVHDARSPWGESALRWLFTENQWDKEKLRPLIEEVLSKPGHRAFGAALNLYSDIVEKQVAGAKFAAIAGDEKFSAKERERAKNVREAIFTNPFLGIEVKLGESSGGDGLTPLETVIFTNISPQEITLSVSSAEELLVIRVVSDKGVVTPLKPIQHKEGGKLTLKPGEHAEIHNVIWWEWLDFTGMNLEGLYDVSFQARTPWLWEVPAKTNWSWCIEGKKIGKVIEAASK